MLLPAEHEVHIWCVSLKVTPETAARLYASLSIDEQERSSRFHFQHDQQHFVVAHGALRDLLGRYLALQPARLSYVYNAFGKPELSPVLGSRLRFNLSHSADLALIAIAANVDVGIDLEAIREQSGYAAIAQQFFAATEIQQLDRLQGRGYTEAFLRYWTRKEAYLKARGDGLTIPLDSFTIPQASNPPYALPGCQTPEESVRMEGWSLYDLQPAPDYLGALAIEGNGWGLKQYQWMP
ncbi:4'-phosphopantetheinyl transferase family protein [Vogesella facilis]|uniref:4'-phosphopantetheinyl transferase family protein n=1 Tax=Vogesella facilis TaxID=1655232 RepID=A0ABV7RBQ9_9NEIS